MEVLYFDDPEFRIDPYPSFQRVQEAGSFCWVEPHHLLGVTRYADVAAVLKNPKIFSSSGLENVFPPIEGAEFFGRSDVLIGSDPPAHSRVRRLVQRAFTLPEMAKWETRVEGIANALVEKMIGRPSFDLIADFAMPLPVAVIAEMLGVDPEKRLDFKRWSDDMVSVQAVRCSQDLVWRKRREREIVASCQEFIQYFEEIMAQRRRDRGGHDLISAMVEASENEQILRPDEVLHLTRLLLVAGNETTTNLLGNAMRALLSHPQQWQLLVQNPELAGAAVEEALRWDGPVLHLSRRVTEDTELAGKLIPQGTIVSVVLAAANRDPRKFEEANRFDIRRNSRDHIAFGLGAHLCVGAPLARIEARIALRILATHFSDVTFAKANFDYIETLFLRGHQSLPLMRQSAQAVKQHAGLDRMQSSGATS